jgi:acyl carrier protein
MEKEQILSELQYVFREILDQEDLMVGPETTADDVEVWDSLNHIQLVVAFEKHFKVRFTSTEIRSWKNVGELVDNISRKRI